MTRFVMGLSLAFLSVLAVAQSSLTDSPAQTAPPAIDSQALTVDRSSIVALTGGRAVNDVTLTGTVTTIVGSDTQTGTASFIATNTNNSRIELNLPSGKRTDIQNGSHGVSTGAWSINDGSLQRYAAHNSWNDAGWFFPALGSLADASSQLSYVAIEKRGGVSVQHLRSRRANGFVPLAQQWSTQDLYIDAATSLPLALVFNVHPDDDSSITIPVEVRFSDYQAKSGLMVPLHIQKFVNYGLVLDFQVSEVVANSGVPANQFSAE
jgi:hypothetical protein